MRLITKKLKTEVFMNKKINFQKLPSVKGGAYVYGFYIRNNHKKSSYHAPSKMQVSNFLKKEIKKFKGK